jgi:hypothetical protein
MARQIVDVDGLGKRLPLTKHQIYKAVKHEKYPLPHKKFGKRLLFDLERVYRWFDSLPGKDTPFDDNEGSI